MNFYQKIITAVTVLIIGVTVLGIILFAPDSPSESYYVKIGAIIIAELIFGITSLVLQKSKDSNLPFTFTYSFGDIVYFLFVIVMAFLDGIMSFNLYIFLHIAGLVFLLISKFVISTATKNMNDQEQKDSRITSARKELFQNMFMVFETAKLKFPENKEFLQKCQTLTDNLRYAGNEHCKTETFSELMTMIKSMQTAADSGNEADFANFLEKLVLKEKTLHNYS